MEVLLQPKLPSFLAGQTEKLIISPSSSVQSVIEL